MPSKLVAFGVGLIVVAVAAALLGALALLRDDAQPANGELIAYSCKEPKNPWWAICTIRSDGTENRRLTSHLPTSDPAWSPDGRKIAFTRREDVGDYTTLSEDDVFVMDSDGGGERQLTKEVEGQHAGQPSWSPDGRAIVFTRGASLPSTLTVRPGDIHVMNADGSDVRRLTQGSYDAGGVWSPDGREIAFSRMSKDPDDPSREIWVVAAAGGEPRQLTRTADSYDASPAWSPDGTRIAFTRLRAESEFDGSAVVWIMNRDGTRLREVVRHKLFSIVTWGLAWSPDGRTIAFETSPTRACTAISLVDVASSQVRSLTKCTRPRESTLSPAWQPDTSVGEP
jgi:Tol biopolymer transport system component